MHKDSTNWLVGELLAKPLIYYSGGTAINVSIQLMLVYIGLFNFGTALNPEQLPTFLERVVAIGLPILPPYSAGDVLNFILNVVFGLLLGSWRMMKWSAGMSR